MIHRDDSGAVCVLRLEHGKVSALDVELLQAIVDVLAEVERSTARAVVLTGTGSSFSAGVDLWRLLDGGAAYVQRFLPLLDAAFRSLFLFPRPVVAAVNGHAVAGGSILASACDRSLMAAGKGKVGVPELRVGVPFPALALEIVRFATGEHAREVVLTGAVWGPEEARARGLVDEVVPEGELMPRALALAEELASIPAESFRLVKQQMRAPAIQRAADAAHATGARVFEAWCDPEIHATVRAYLERTIGKRSA